MRILLVIATPVDARIVVRTAARIVLAASLVCAAGFACQSNEEQTASEEEKEPSSDRSEDEKPAPDSGGEREESAPSARDESSGDVGSSKGGPRSVDATVGIEEDFDFTRRRSIRDLPDLKVPEGEAPTSRVLGRRSRGGARDVAEGVTVKTECGDRYCVDGIAADGRTLLDAVPTQRPDDDGELERVVRVSWATDEYVSAYIATSHYTGGANAENDLRCRTFDRRTGEIVPLGEILDERSAERLLAKAETLLVPERAMAVIGRRIDAENLRFRSGDFRLARTEGYRGIDPEIILCGKPKSPDEGAEVLEMQVEEFPVGYLLRPLEK